MTVVQTPQETIIDLMKKQVPDCLPPTEVAVKAKAVGITKANSTVLNVILLGIIAGVFIGLGAMLNTIVTTNTGLGFGLTKLLGGLVFCLGLILVVLAGAELFTGNNLLVMGWLSGKISLGQLFKNWGVVYFANLLGALSLVFLMFYTHQWGLSNNGVGANAILIANAKVNLSFVEALTRGILCNALVCLAIWLCYSARTMTDKIMAIIFPITAFVAAGFEHSIANMYFIPIGILLASEPTVVQTAAVNISNLTLVGFINNLVPVTIGNIIGGGIFVGVVYWAVYLRQDQYAMSSAIKQRFAKMLFFLRRHQVAHPAERAIAGKVTLKEALARSLIARYAQIENFDVESPECSSALRDLLARAVLAKTSGENEFFKNLAEKPSEILKNYALTASERAALSCGNTDWLESKISTLNDPLGISVTLGVTLTENSNSLAGKRQSLL